MAGWFPSLTRSAHHARALALAAQHRRKAAWELARIAHAPDADCAAWSRRRAGEFAAMARGELRKARSLRPTARAV